MIPKEALDFVEKVQGILGLRQIILYGSWAKNDYTEKSDIDLLLIFGKKPKNEIKKKITTTSREIEKKSGRKLELVMISDYDEMDETFLEEVEKFGIVLYGKPDLKSKKMDVIIFFYSLEKQKVPDKHRIKRALYGDKNFKGAVKETGAIRLGKGSVLIKREFQEEIESILKQFNVKYDKFPASISENDFKRIKVLQ